MKTSGELLHQARLSQKLNLEELSLNTKIPVNFLLALEKNDYHLLPSSTYIKGFIKNYSQALNLDPKKTLAVFKRDYYSQPQRKIVPKGLEKPLNSGISLNSSSKSILSFVSLLILLGAYLAISLHRLNQPPSLTITQPQEGQELSNPVLIKGKTHHDATLTLNGKIVNLEPDGSFTTTYNGSPGANQLELISTSRRQKITETSLHIIIQ